MSDLKSRHIRLESVETNGTNGRDQWSQLTITKHSSLGFNSNQTPHNSQDSHMTLTENNPWQLQLSGRRDLKYNLHHRFSPLASILGFLPGWV